MGTAEIANPAVKETERTQVGRLPCVETQRRTLGKAWIACGIFLLVLGAYALSSPGRIDIVDGEARFDVAYNWIVNGRPMMTDTWLIPFMSVPGRDGLRYSYYGAPGSVFALPLVWLGLHSGGPPVAPSQFLFSLTSSLLGAAIAPILFLFYLELGVTRRSALAWTMVSSFATYIWAISNSTFDNAQHAFFALGALYFAYLSGRRKSAKYALLGGAMAGVLVLYQDYFLLIVPALALATLQWKPESDFTVPALAGSPEFLGSRLLSRLQGIFEETKAQLRLAWEEPGDARSSCRRYCLFLAAVGVGILLSMAYNDLRFGSWIHDSRFRFAAERHFPVFGNPLTGFLTLLVSPGKSVFLYSPAVVIGLLGIRQLWRRKPVLATVIAASSVLLVLFLSCISFAGGDWCWGPRYLAPLLTMWALAFPFAPRVKGKRQLAVALIAVGFVVQILALSVENQRFFLERRLNDYFWAEQPWFYMKHSALFARVGEFMSLSKGVPPTATLFNSIPVPNWCTYTLLGPPLAVPRSLAPLWIQHFKIFYLPRPWPLWMSSVPLNWRPINMAPWIVALFGLTAVGAGMVYRGLQVKE